MSLATMLLVFTMRTEPQVFRRRKKDTAVGELSERYWREKNNILQLCGLSTGIWRGKIYIMILQLCELSHGYWGGAGREGA